VTRDEFIRRLEELRSHGRRVFLIGVPLALLLEIPIVVYVVIRSRALFHTQKAAFLLLCGVAPCLAIIVALNWVVRWTIAKYAPTCPRCGATISWRQRASTLDSGQSPGCKKELFQDS
jgi:hypothetical protein